jgi:hypothetical protein
MCSKPSVPTPQAPPSPVPQRDSVIESTQARQSAARRAAGSGYDSTVLTGPGGLSGEAPTTSPVLGG